MFTCYIDGKRKLFGVASFKEMYSPLPVQWPMNGVSCVETMTIRLAKYGLS